MGGRARPEGGCLFVGRRHAGAEVMGGGIRTVPIARGWWTQEKLKTRPLAAGKTRSSGAGNAGLMEALARRGREIEGSGRRVGPHRVARRKSRLRPWLHDVVVVSASRKARNSTGARSCSPMRGGRTVRRGDDLPACGQSGPPRPAMRVGDKLEAFQGSCVSKGQSSNRQDSGRAGHSAARGGQGASSRLNIAEWTKTGGPAAGSGFLTGTPRNRSLAILERCRGTLGHALAVPGWKRLNGA